MNVAWLRRKNQRAYLMLLALGVGLTISTVAFVITLHLAKAEMAFSQYGDSLREHVHDRLLGSENVLGDFAALLAILPDTQQEKLAQYARQVRERHPYIYSIELSRRVEHQELPALTAAMRQRYPEFYVKTFDYAAARKWRAAAEKPVYYPLLFIEPLRAESRPVLGLDLDSVPFLRDALLRTQQQGTLATTPPFELAQGGRAYALLKNIPIAAPMDSNATALVAALLIETGEIVRPHLLPHGANLEICLRIPGATPHDGKAELFHQAATPHSALEQWLLPRLSDVRVLPNLNQPFELELHQQLGWSDFDVELLAFIFAAGVITFSLLLVYVRALHRSERLRLESEVKLEEMANYDTLTGLPNRNLLWDRIGSARQRAERNGHKLALMFLDLDGFKKINDTHGHAMGDRLLQAFAQRVQACLRDTDTVARLGGDEFVVLLEQVKGEEDIDRVAQKVGECLCPPFVIDDIELSLGVSIGVALYPDHGDDPEQLLRHADQAMYSVKRCRLG